MKIDEKILINNGYKKYNNSLRSTKGLDTVKYAGSYQKLIKDKKGKKYYIDIDVYDFFNLPLEKGFDAEVQFNKKDDVFDVSFHINKDTTIDCVENFFENIWEKMKCDYYEKYGD